MAVKSEIYKETIISKTSNASKKSVHYGLILSNRIIAPGVFKMVFHSPEAAAAAVPGQFINIRCPAGDDLVLRRPVSICSCDRSLGEMTIVYEIRGKGTLLLSRMREGTRLDFMGPLGGRGFTVDGRYDRLITVGGGIGTFPLLFLLEEYAALFPDVRREACLGFRNCDCVVLEDEFKKAVQEESDVHVTTDDGSYCLKGYVTCSLSRLLENPVGSESPIDGGSANPPKTLVCACGPAPMLKQAAVIAARFGADCEVSLEERMGCGIGACLVCACSIKNGNGESDYKHVCSDGPVFNAKDVDFDG